MYQTAAPSTFVVDGKQYNMITSAGVNALKNTALIIGIFILLKG